MGRPLNKKYFTGDNDLNLKLEVAANIGGTVISTNIVRQRSNLKYEVAAGTLGTPIGPNGAPGLAITSAGANDVITDTGDVLGSFITAGFVIGGYVVISAAADTENNGTYELANVTADALTLVGDGVLTLNAADTTMVLTPMSGDTVVCKLVDEASPSVAGTMSIAVDPVVTVGIEYARIINAHQVKTFDGSGGIYGNTYAWPDLATGNFRGPDGDSGPQFEEADLQT